MRSLLFVPGSRPDRIAKALDAGADAVCVDLEDAVGADDKAAAREAVLRALADGGRPDDGTRRANGADRPGFGVRVNSLATAWGCADVAALAAAPAPAFVMVPKAEHAAELRLLRGALGGDRAPGLIPVIESAAGLEAAYGIAAAPGVEAVLFGGGDMAADLGAAMTFEPLLHARGRTLAAAAAAGRPAIDVPYLDVADADGLAEECRRVKAMGYAAKACIHPAQVDAVNAAFAPAPDELAHARKVVAALEAARGGAVLVEGRLVEAPVIRRARQVLAAAGEQGGA